MKYIWLIGENLGETANNNSFYYWKYIVDHDDEIDAYFVMKRNAANRIAYRAMNAKERKFVVWRNAPKHIWLYEMADMLFVTLSSRDVQPDHILFKSYRPLPVQPLVYLQHGTIGIKSIGCGPAYANNCLSRFVYYNPLAAELLMEGNGLKAYQLYHGVYLPRYVELVRKNRNRPAHTGVRMLWFMTWREYFGDNPETQAMLNDIEAVISDAGLLRHLDQTQSTLTLCTHRAFSASSMAKIKTVAAGNTHIRLLFGCDINVMDEVANNDLLITDYSSLGFDFTILNKPVILYQPDRDAYLTKRKLSCTLQELAENSLDERGALVDALVNRKYGVNPFFRRRLPDVIDLDGIEKGDYIAQMYQYFRSFQQKSIAFWGYDFSGIGGTVMATRALAEGLMEQGYLVRLFTLKRQYHWVYPAGIPLKPMYNRYKPKLSDKVKVALVRSKRHFRYLQRDPARRALQPIAGLGITYWMKRIHANTVVSTRESLHFFLHEATSPMIQNKVYFFHTPSLIVGDQFPGCIPELDKMNLKKVIFVTENNRIALKEKHGYAHYQTHCVLGNALDSSRTIAREAIVPVSAKECYSGAYLLRISHERAAELDELIRFARYLKANDIASIRVDVYGNGDYVETFLGLIKQWQVERYICYCGLEPDIAKVLGQHDFSVNFSLVQSFGMIYIESILNGKMMFCYHNEGSDDVLAEIPECMIASYADLVNKILALPSISAEQMRSYYDLIWRRFSRTAVAQKFIAFVDQADGAVL